MYGSIPLLVRSFSYIVCEYTTLVWVLRLSRVIPQSDALPVGPENDSFRPTGRKLSDRRCRQTISASSVGNAQTILDAAGKRRFGRKSARPSLVYLPPASDCMHLAVFSLIANRTICSTRISCRPQFTRFTSYGSFTYVYIVRLASYTSRTVL